eukprot:CAMPEP_0206371488 /NCGR_PEP_ID=MMETSP0294-20121207/6508_1 /ASSEMBLY_ACC=CAM_ASM_000327 /TAXON_ID=39354 /ORGANISM="Heterosigma akashiwo, Strain CCMP2393" /LENGTH=342 /DNA_ID=CAMNT_0053818615 /DNA_START=69 /DNA_END=1097 /DNA_ORIENTATION=+
MSATRFKQHNPDLPIAIATNAEKNAIPDVFDIHIPIARQHLLYSEGQMIRQWLTRIKYMALTPFKTTLMVDASTISCSKGVANLLLGPHFKRFDIAIQTENLGTLRPHNCVLVYRNTAATLNLLKHWDSYHQCAKHNQDDQDTLQVTLLELSLRRKLSVGVLADNFATAMVSRAKTTHTNNKGKNNGVIFPRLTHVLYPGVVHMMHSSYLGPDATCNLLNSQIHSKRVVWVQFESGQRVMRSLALKDDGQMNAPQSLLDSLVQLNHAAIDISVIIEDKYLVVISLKEYITSLNEYNDTFAVHDGSGYNFYRKFIGMKLGEKYTDPAWPNFGKCARIVFPPGQ